MGTVVAEQHMAEDHSFSRMRSVLGQKFAFTLKISRSQTL